MLKKHRHGAFFVVIYKGERKAGWKGFQSKYKSGLLKLYAQHAVSSMKGAYME